MFNDRSTVRRLTLTVAAGAGALTLLAACGGSDTGTHSPSGHSGAQSSAAASPSTSAPAAAFNEADVMFAQMMIPHHRQAVEMADLAATRASDKEVKDLAAKIKAAQDPEIVTLTGWLTSWGKPVPAEGDAGGHGAHGGMPGMMTPEDLAKLAAAKGTAFDKLFAEQMIAHHNGAIEMARTEVAQGANPEAKALAATIGSTQQTEVDQLKKILDRL
ncbi:DUF305 domain-containing protein [Rhizohabitans arisaemae]|uniref:DUF305 domain-containing protein n=1 Tax=Rhizohabitans arisaemae TaxID=2720610 RepID=UPI0024B1FEC5|nr:DUF305 domain-containing protein [Rhizohabitans arisaemae]